MHTTEHQRGLERLTAIVRRLIAPDGCPWDRSQTLSTMKQYLLEEAYELAETMEGDPQDHRTELGDLLFQIVFQALLREQEGHFDLDAAIDTICEKLINRHPHIFGDAPTRHEPDESLWEQQKLQEKKRHSLMDDIPLTLPALLRSDKIQRRAAAAGFDWPDPEGPMEKVKEELGELQAVMYGQEREKIHEELGDLLFAVANLSRHLGINPETALMAANAKFEKRFRLMEQLTAREGKELKSLPLDIQDEYWVRAKLQLRGEREE